MPDFLFMGAKSVWHNVTPSSESIRLVCGFAFSFTFFGVMCRNDPRFNEL